MTFPGTSILRAQHALNQITDRYIAGKANTGVVVYLNGGPTLYGRDVAYDDAIGLLIMDSGRIFVRPEQVAAIAIAQELT